MQEVSWRGSLKLVLEDGVIRPIVGGEGRWGGVRVQNWGGQ